MSMRPVASRTGVLPAVPPVVYVPTTDESDPALRHLAGAAAGAGVGAAVGSVVPVAGTAVGAVVGGMVGAGVSIFADGAIDSLFENGPDVGAALGEGWEAIEDTGGAIADGVSGAVSAVGGWLS